jgi:hypothetical protein
VGRGLDWQHIYTSELVGHVRVNYVSNQFGEGVNGQPDTTTIAYTTAKTTLTWTPTASNSIEVGVTGQRGTVTAGVNVFGIDTSASSNFYMAYLNWSCYLYPELVLNAGLFSQYISYNTKSSFEPRVSLAWTPAEAHTFAIAFGIHRQPEPLAFAQATHYVLGYTYRPDPNVLVKVEGYLKEYKDVPVHAYQPDSYSFMNVGDAETIQYFGLTNTGKGRTYGAEFTLLKHYSSGFYITATASLVRQEFAGSDGNWHFGSFDNRYILNLLSGYDIQLTPTSYLTLSEKFTLAGGGMYTPIDLMASDSLGYQILDSAHAFGSRNSPYVRLDLNVEFHFNWQKSSMTLYASVLNILNIKNPIDHYYQSNQTPPYTGPGSIQEDLDLPILPVLGFRIEF